MNPNNSLSLMEKKRYLIEDLEIELRSLTINDSNYLNKREELKDSIATEKAKLKYMRKGNNKYNKLF